MKNQRNVLLTITVLALALCCITVSVHAQISPQTIKKTFNVGLGGQLTLNSLVGTINVQTINQNRVEVVYTKAAKAALDQLNREAFEDFDVTFRQSGANIYIVGKFKRGWEYWLKRVQYLKIHLWHISFEVRTPHRYHLDLKTGYGADIQVGNIGGTVKAETYGGDLKYGVIEGSVWGKTAGGGNIVLERCENTVNVETYGGNVQLGYIMKDVKAKSAGGGNITLNEGKGKVELETYGGDIEVGNVRRDAKVENAGNGNISINNVGGTLHAETYGGDLYFGTVNGIVWGKTAGGGNITLKECRSKVDVETYGGDIGLDNITRDVKAETAGGGNISIGNVGGSVEAETYGGDLHFGIIKGVVRGETAGGGNITLKECHSRVNVETYGGYIEVEMTRQPRSQWILETGGSGEIITRLTSNIAINVDAYAGSGSVSSDFRVQGSTSKNSIKGTINGGGTLLKMRASSGDIYLRRK